MITNPLKHQIEARDFLRKSKYAILADNMGLGKSYSALLASADAEFLLIICPAYLKANWSRELKKWNYDKNHIIVSYEYITNKNTSIESYIEMASHIIIDECHYVKNVGAKRTKALHQHIKHYRPEYVFLLSGTPAKNRVPELYSLFMLCSYGNKDTLRFMSNYYSYWEFSDFFSWAEKKEIQGRTTVKYSGHRNLDKLKELMATCYLRRLKMDEDLPSMRDINIYLDLEDEEVNYSELFESFIKTNKPSGHLMARKSKNALTKAPYTAKFCKDLIENGEAEQIVIFCDHVNSIKVIADELGAKYIDGSIDMNTRDYIVQSFIRGDSKYLCTTIGTGSTGLNLVNSNVMVFNSLPWVTGDLEQAKKRTNRIGQTKDCLYYTIIGSKFDEMLLKVLDEKSRTLKEVL